MMEETLSGDQTVCVVLLKPGWEGNYYGSPDVHEIGCVGRIAEHKLLPDGRYNIAIHGEYKVSFQSFDRNEPYRIARVQRVEEDESWTRAPGSSEQAQALLELFQKAGSARAAGFDLTGVFGPHMGSDAILNTIAMYLNIDPAEKQRLLEMESVELRYRAVHDFLRDTSAVQDSLDRLRHLFPDEPRRN
jgi:Lon protease-like protein